MINWPNNLPRPTINYTLQAQPSVSRTRMDSGRCRQRRRFMGQQHQVEVQWSFTDAEFQLFKSVHWGLLAAGADWFELELLSGDGVKQHKARFIGGGFASTYQDNGGWLVSAALELKEVEYIPADVLGLVLSLQDEMTITDLLGFTNELERTVNFNHL